eukprot:CAMPEP_0204823294 /NCGR_PEP_ID=MMETSP1346-20131115/1351_1 /ASSEMBLY_ACC=CAM_ASM_000771 /TAXON_ID=215587 /ORGANISM="Aplanochytrium stocchinoi, Strain GSBS06" /LENGTH=207 /DNA_ID=CAMNT_0051949869 /DNA_START=314 /DNA_END=937 /DNA_ORIENTATION=+
MTAAEVEEELVEILKEDELEIAAGYFRGIAAIARAKAPLLKQTARTIGQQRSLAFASEGGVAAKSMLPKYIYYAAWGISGVAVCADILAKTWDAPEEKQLATAGYQMAFHVPASLIIPAVIIHRIVHAAEHAVEKVSPLKALPPRVKSLVPVACALLSIIPVVPVVDHTMEMIMEPTLGAYLNLEFDHHHHTPSHEHQHHKNKEKQE